MWYDVRIKVSRDAGQCCHGSDNRPVVSGKIAASAKIELESLLEKYFQRCVLREREGDECVCRRHDEGEENQDSEVAVKLRAERCEGEDN